MNSHSDICIIGNGAIGKTAALGFAQAGASVTLIETPPAAVVRPPAADGEWDLRVYALNPLAQSLLARIKVWDALDAARVTTVDGMVVSGDHEKYPGQIAFDAYGARVGALAYVVEDRNLNQALDTALKFSASVRRVQCAACALATDAAGGVVRLADGDSVQAELIIGADGGHSWVRAQAHRLRLPSLWTECDRDHLSG